MNNIPMLAGLIKPRDISINDKFDKILKAYLDNKLTDLDQDLQRCLERWEMVNEKLRQGHLIQRGKDEFNAPYNFGDLVKFITTTYNVSIRTAYDDIKSAKRFFAIPETKVDDDFAKGLFLERLEERSAFFFAKGFYKEAAKCDELIAKIRRWDQPAPPELPKYAEMQIPQLVLVASASELGFTELPDPKAAVDRILKKRKKGVIDKLVADADVVDLMKAEDDGAEDLA